MNNIENQTQTINIDNQKTELIKEETNNEVRHKFKISEKLNDKNEQILDLQKQIFELKTQNENLKNYSENIKNLTNSIANKYGVADFEYEKYLKNINFDNLEKFEKSIINIFESNDIKYNKPKIVVNNNKKMKIFI